MDTDACSPATFFCICENKFYFEVGETDVDEDAFGMSIDCLTHLIKSRDNKFLLLNDDGQFEIQNLTIQQQCQPGCKFNIQIYIDSSQVRRPGRHAMLYVNKGGKKMVACCSENRDIYPEAMDLPHLIRETVHKALFHLTKLSSTSNKYMFESSLYPSEFLGFEQDGDNPSLNKLVLRRKDQDEMDESCEFMFSKSK